MPYANNNKVSKPQSITSLYILRIILLSKLGTCTHDLKFLVGRNIYHSMGGMLNELQGDKTSRLEMLICAASWSRNRGLKGHDDISFNWSQWKKRGKNSVFNLANFVLFCFLHCRFVWVLHSFKVY